MPDFLFTGVITALDLSTTTVTIDVTNEIDITTATTTGQLYLTTFQDRWLKGLGLSTINLTPLARPVSI